jgi:hypothetical protein
VGSLADSDEDWERFVFDNELESTYDS